MITARHIHAFLRGVLRLQLDNGKEKKQRK